jgi:hypothetical protein
MPEAYWHHGYLPFTHRDSGYNQVLFIDTAHEDPRELSPIWYHAPVWETFDAPRMPSLTDTVQLWVNLLETDTWHWNAEEDNWDIVDERIPPEALQTRVI